MKQSLVKVLAGIKDKFSKGQPEETIVPNDELRFKLGVKPGHKVCLFHAPEYILPLFLAGDLKLTLDWVESNSDVILYWLQPQDDVADIVVNLERMIKSSGRIWLIVPKQEASQKRKPRGNREDIGRIVLEVTSLVDNKTIIFGKGECGTQFVSRRGASGK